MCNEKVIAFYNIHHWDRRNKYCYILNMSWYNLLVKLKSNIVQIINVFKIIKLLVS